MRNLGKYTERKNSGQYAPAKGYEDQMVQNHEGAYSFKVDDLMRLRRWLLLGSEGGSFYQTEEELTLENVQTLEKFIEENSKEVLKVVEEHVDNRWYIRPYYCMFAAVLLTSDRNREVKNDAYRILNKLATTPFNLFRLLNYFKQTRGFGHSVRKFVQGWYLSKDKHTLYYQTLKYRSRDGWTHRDALLQGHVKPFTDWQQELFHFLAELAKGKAKLTDVPPNDNFAIGLKKLYELPENFWTGRSFSEVIDIVTKYRLTWDVIPTEYLNSKELWRELYKNNLVPAQATLRQLPRLAALGVPSDLYIPVLEENADKFSFYEVLRAYGVYRTGKSRNISFTPIGKVEHSLKRILSSKFDNDSEVKLNVESGIVIGVDVSASMTWHHGDIGLTPANLAQIFGSYLARVLPKAKYVEFDTDIRRTSPHKTFDDALNARANGGGTDTSLPFRYAASNGYYDAVVILTDSETWAGQEHAIEIIDRDLIPRNERFKAVNVPFESNPYSTLPNDPRFLEVVGPVPELDKIILEFLKL